MPFLVGIGFYLLFFALAVLPAAGVVIAAGGTPRPRFLGWLFIVVGIGVALVSIRQWARILPGVFGPAVLNGFMILASGHALNQPKVPFPRWKSVLFIAIMVLGAITTASFRNRHLSLHHKVGALGIWACFVAGFTGIVLPLNGWEVPVGIALVICLSWIQIVNKRHKRT